MKIVLYDPLYSKIGHYERYTNYIAELVCAIDAVKEVVYYTEMPDFEWSGKKSKKLKVERVESKMHSFQELSIKVDGLQRIRLGFNSFLHYLKILKSIEKENADKVIFLSQGIFSFWMVLSMVGLKYSTSIISIKWLFENKGYRNVLKKLFEKYLKKADAVFFTEQMYVNTTANLKLKNSFVLPDRYLDVNLSRPKQLVSRKEKIKLVTLGTISANKNPIDFIKEFNKVDKEIQANFEYFICGKVLDKNLDEFFKLVDENPNINLKNEYIKEEEFDVIYESSDLVVIPYPSEYTNYATSGIMWDCFMRRSLIFCPENELFNHYINKYGIGFTYQKNTLEYKLKEIIDVRDDLIQLADNNYNNLYSDISFESMLEQMNAFLHI